MIFTCAPAGKPAVTTCDWGSEPSCGATCTTLYVTAPVHIYIIQSSSAVNTSWVFESFFFITMPANEIVSLSRQLVVDPVDGLHCAHMCDNC